jgi:hypothetical protein
VSKDELVQINFLNWTNYGEDLKAIEATIKVKSRHVEELVNWEVVKSYN